MTKLMTAAFMALQLYAQQEDLTLRVHAGNIRATVLFPARAHASRILGQLGVHVFWAGPNEQAVELQGDQCAGPTVDVRDIEIQLLDRTPVRDHPDALGYSLPFAKSGVRVVIFYDRVAAWTQKPSPELLGHVIAHEVGHMLMGTFSHAATGLMRAHWTGGEMSELQHHPLHFTASDMDFIGRRLQQQYLSCSPKVAAAPVEVSDE